MNKHHSPRRIRILSLLPLATGLAAITTTGALQGAVTLNSSVSFVSGIYTYSYTVTNFGTTFDLAIVDLSVGPGQSISNLTAPTGFNILFDADPVNLVSFLEDSDFGTPQTFAANSTSGTFSFDSPLAPSVATFSALDANGDTYTGITQSPVPEPSSLLLFASLAAPLVVTRRRRSKD